MSKKSSGTAKRQIHESGGEALEAAQAKKRGITSNGISVG